MKYIETNNIFKIEVSNSDKYKATVYSLSYQSLFYRLHEIEQELKELNTPHGYILIDNLLSKGDGSSRFVECYLNDKGLLVRSTIKTVELAKEDSIRKQSSKFYRELGENFLGGIRNV